MMTCQEQSRFMLLTVQSIMSREADSEAVSKEDQRCPNISFLIFVGVVEIESLNYQISMHVHASEQFECIASYASRRSAVDLCSKVSIQKRLTCISRGQCVPSPILKATNK
jgi:hypothetical protein